MKFFVNFLSAFRIFASFAIIGTLMSGMFLTTIILFVLAMASDFFDGYLARKYNACTKLGNVLDSIADKFLITTVFILLCMMMRVWFIVIPIILMILRELYVSGLREFLGTQRVSVPHPRSRFAPGKIKAAMQMLSVLAFLCWLFIGASINDASTSKATLYAIYALPNIGIFALWFALATSIWSAVQYTVDFARAIKKIK